MKNSSNYTDHLAWALRCLDNKSLRQLATAILDRLPKNQCHLCNGEKGVMIKGEWIGCHECGETGIAYLEIEMKQTNK